MGSGAVDGAGVSADVSGDSGTVEEGAFEELSISIAESWTKVIDVSVKTGA
jgi:hypothetical protein